ncbi:MAG: type II secretion system protein [Phycisphaerales bacterium]
MGRAGRHLGLAYRVAVTAFTLMEMLVVIAIVALVAAGMAAIFASVGDTVAAGKRVSALNRYANLLESVMREDFARMTRDGFLVIRNEKAVNGNPVPLYPGQPQSEWRVRRIDEIMFFMRGDFVSARRALSPGYNAVGNEAEIWYGHGQRRPEDLVMTQAPSYLYPWPGDKNMVPDARLGWPAVTAGAENPNLYASDWTLLRHQTVLTPPAAGESRVPRDPVFDIDPATLNGRRRLRDHAWQVGLQPAAQSVYHARLDDVFELGGLGGGGGGGGGLGRPNVGYPLMRPNALVRQGDHGVWPRYSSGLVDVCTESLADVRSIATSAGLPPATAPNDYFTSTGQFDTTNVASRANARLWMLDALPAEYGAPGNTRYRMRYEPTPPLLSIPESLILGAGSTAARVRAYREADQEALTDSVFIPRCTEFIVEWSFGSTYTNPADPRFGQLQWFGLDRAEVDTNGDGVVNAASDLRVTDDFGRAVTGDVIHDTAEQNRIAELVLGRVGGGGGFGGPLVNLNVAEAAFGYYDPGTNLNDTSDDGTWPWPKLVRITMSFTDPRDPTYEARTQFVVEIPGGGAQ